MGLSPEEIAAADKIHAFVRGWEKRKKFSSRRMLAAFISGPLVGGGFHYLCLHLIHASDREFLLILGGIVVLALCSYAASKARYRREKILLQVLERDHASELPWVEEERIEAKYTVDVFRMSRMEGETAAARAT